MARDRFKNILRFIRFDDMTTRKIRQETDSLAPIRFVLDSIKSNLLAAYSPGQWLTIDEYLCRYRGRCHFRQYIPSKPDRYGIKIYVLADSRNYYPLNFEVYSGKQAVSNSPKDLVLRLISVLNAGHIICGDNFFSSLSLSSTLALNSSIYYLGTIRKCRKEIPKTVQDIKGLPPYSSRILYSEDSEDLQTSPILYYKKNKSVLLLSNIHSCKIIPIDSKKSKPSIILDYNHNKCGVDKFGQMVKEYRIYRASRRWPLVLFFDLLGFSCFSSWVIFCLKFPDHNFVKSKNRREFLYILGKELIYLLVVQRRKSSNFNKYTFSLKKCIIDNLPKESGLVLPCISSTESTSIIPTLTVSQAIPSDNDEFTPILLALESTTILPTLPSIESISMPTITNLDTLSVLPQIHSNTFSLLNDNIMTTSSTISDPTHLLPIESTGKVVVKRRCLYCPRSKDTKVSSVCRVCNVNVCKIHSIQYFVCTVCSETIF